eukprot:423785-Alexandrium_andersonii.AAC.1
MQAPPDEAAHGGGLSSGGVTAVSVGPKPGLSASQKDTAAEQCGVDDPVIVARGAGLTIPKLGEYLQRFIEQRRAQDTNK